jgi:biopolymer transport protein ExbB/TolQ
MSIQLPGAVYGKNTTSPGKVARNFHWMKRHHEFPDAIFSLADQWCQRFQWMSVGESRHKPVALWIPVIDAPGGALLLHFADAGLDDRGRPGTLSLEAAWASEEAIRQHPKLREFFLVEAVQTESFMTDAEESMICIQLDSDIAELSRTLSGKASTTAIMASVAPYGFSLQGLEKVLFLDANTWQEKKESGDVHESIKPSSSRKRTEQKQPPQNLIPTWTPKNNRPWGWLSLVVLLLALLTFSGYILWMQHLEIDQLIREKNVLAGQYSDSEHEAKQLLEALNQERAIRTEIEAENSELQTEAIKLEKDLAEKNEEIETLYESVEEASKERIQNLEKECENYSSLLDRIKKILRTLIQVIPGFSL